MVYKFCYPKIFIIIPIKNPTSPMARTPNAEILEIIRNSCLVGFLRMRQTRMHWIMKDFIFSIMELRLKCLKIILLGKFRSYIIHL